MPCGNEPPLSSEVLEQLALLEHSQGLIRAILLGIALQYRALDLQKCLLLEGSEEETAPCPDPKAMQIAASLIVLCALFGFQKQAECIAGQEAASGACPDWMEPKLNATVILVGLLRLCRLAAPPQPPSQGALPEAAGLQEAEEDALLAEPVV